MRSKEKRTYPRLWRCSRGTALPVTYLMLFVSLTLIISATYYLAITRISARGQALNFVGAKQAMTSLESNIEDVLWSPWASRAQYVDDFGGNFEIEPAAKTLIVNITDGTFHEIIFNSSVGRSTYQLYYAEPGSSGSFLRGDSRVIISDNSLTLAQLQIVTGQTSQEIQLAYRPFASSTVTDLSGSKPVNAIRIYIVSMNSSENLTFPGSFYLKAKCQSVYSTTRSYNLSYAISSIQVEAILDGVNGSVSLPVFSNQSGTILDVEVLICNIQLQGVTV